MILFRRKMVRVHQVEKQGERPVPEIDGVLVGKPWRCGGHYVVRKAEVLQSENNNVPLGEVWIPRERVVFLEVLSK